ncbi:hypothetical protein Tco_1288742, partial [Tanacetum coccineum]
SDILRHDQKCKNMKHSQDMQLIQKLRDDQKRMKKVFEVMSGRNIVTNSRVTPSWREIVSLTFSEAGVLHVNWISFGHCVNTPGTSYSAAAHFGGVTTKDSHYKGKAVVEANVTKCDDEESDLSLATSSSRNASEIWLLDSACNHHITPHREWFSNFEEHKEVVYTADETPLTTHGIGSVRLQNEDGIIVTLKGVHYSPKLKKNLISVGTLESKWFKVRAKDGVMKIISGVLIVMKGIRKINNTYHYKGRTVVGTVAAVTDGDKNSEAVKLCA